MIEIILVLVAVLVISQVGVIWYMLGMATNMVILNNKLGDIYKIIATADKKKKRVVKQKPIGFLTNTAGVDVLNKKK
jgi:hypothetical protein